MAKKSKKKVKGSDEDNIESRISTNYVSWAVFLFSIPIVLISFVAVIFPGILATDTIKIPGVDTAGPYPFETGLWSGAEYQIQYNI
ncbi:MAG: hypothetical protein OER78_05615 [Nitrosopumilus sp.]|nr:hypothetical protein [Nitrosopumilus sp.]